MISCSSRNISVPHAHDRYSFTAPLSIIRSVSLAISQLATQYVKFPSDEEGFRTLKSGFFGIAEFPKVIGIVHNFHVHIKPPTVDPKSFVNKKGVHSINCQLICDSDLQLLDLVAKFKGSTPNHVIWQKSGIRHRCDSGKLPYGWFLGDDSHLLHQHLLTPVTLPVLESEVRYNASHSKTREVLKKCLSLLRGRFLCLDGEVCSLDFDPVTCASIIVATAVLHNICLDNHLPFDWDEKCYSLDPILTLPSADVDPAALVNRQQLISLMFS